MIVPGAGLLIRLAVLITLTCSSFPAAALDPSRSIAQYKHTRWTAEEGAPPSISAFAQGPDGYLWIGSHTGLYRFDGATFEQVADGADERLKLSVTALYPAADGSIWVGYDSGIVAVYRDGVLRDMHAPTSGVQIKQIAQGRDGAIWGVLGRIDRSLARYRKGKWEVVGADWGLPTGQSLDLVSRHDGSLWLARLGSVVRLSRGSHRFERLAIDTEGPSSLTEDPQRRLWLSDKRGSRIIAPNSAGGAPYEGRPFPTPPPKGGRATLFDRNGNLWGTSSQSGVYRLSKLQLGPAPSNKRANPLPAIYGQKDGLTSDVARPLLEDHEGNIWVGTTSGLDRFRPASIVVEPSLAAPSPSGDGVFSDRSGVVYAITPKALFRILPGGDPKPLATDIYVDAWCDDDRGNAWFPYGNTLLRFSGGKLSRSLLPKFVVGTGVMDCASDRQGSLWLAAGDDGLFRRVGTQWKQFPLSKPSAPAPTMMVADKMRRLMIYFQNESIDRVDFPLRAGLRVGPGTRISNVSTIYSSPNGDLLFGGRFGLGRLHDQRLQIIEFRGRSWMRSPRGIVQTRSGETWLLSGEGLFRLRTADLDRAYSDPNWPLVPKAFNLSDGLPSLFDGFGRRDVVQGGDGRIWLATNAGVVWLNPKDLARNTVAPPVSIRSLAAGGRRWRDPHSVTLVKGTSSVEIDYTATSLTNPGRVQFRYRLEGVDVRWINPEARRQAFYTNLSPGHYVFRVIAANNDGIWNRSGASLQFDIPPTFLQSGWFKGICGLMVILAAWALYSVRVRQISHRIRARLEERLAEREWLARELHDTLLQGFQGLIFRFQSVANSMSAETKARHLMDEALDRADDVLVDGRNRVQALRISRNGELSEIFADTAAQLGTGSAIEFELAVLGNARDLHPLVREELSRIGDEALINAFRHSHASRIVLTLFYGNGEIALRVQDNGRGVDPNVVHAGKDGHFGLAGMRERADRIGAEFTLATNSGGTVIEVTVAARTAYAPRPRSSWISRFFSHRNDLPL